MSVSLISPRKCIDFVDQQMFNIVAPFYFWLQVYSKQFKSLPAICLCIVSIVVLNFHVIAQYIVFKRNFLLLGFASG